MSRHRTPSTTAAARVSASAALWVAVIATACSPGPSRIPPPQVPHGNPQQGLADIERFGCGACHIIPGVDQATGLAGPPLIHWSQRGFIAGEIQNDGPNLIRWIMDPRVVEPNTAMPDLGVSQDQARDIAAYLFTIH